MATSSADAVLAPTPVVGHGHEILLAAVGLLAVLALFVAAMLVDPREAGEASPTAPLATAPTYQPAPPVHRVGPAVPAFVG